MRRLKGLTMRLLVTGCSASIVWLILQMARTSQAHRILGAGTPAETLIIQPGRSVMALYAFLVLITLLPPLVIAATIWLPGTRGDRDNGGERPRNRALVFYSILVVLGISVSGLIAGFAYESLRSEVRLTRSELAYWSGSGDVRIRLKDVRWIALHYHARSQSMDVATHTDAVHVDLSPFAAPDQLLLLSKLPRFAGLPLINQTDSEFVWRRSGAFQPAE